MRGVSAFQSTLPARGATSVSVTAVLVLAFQSTLPARGATRKDGKTVEADKISIHAPRTGSDAALQEIKAILLEISIHAPRTGSDERLVVCKMSDIDFNPRSPHGERLNVSSIQCSQYVFQSTLPARGATITGSASAWVQTISIHAPRTGSDSRPLQIATPQGISIHAPRTGSDARAAGYSATPSSFQSTLPARGATHHARAPARACTRFQSTLPARGATGSSLYR